jgi:hypothetical protein
MLDPVIVMSKRAAGIVRRVDEHALHLAGELRLQRLQRQQVVTEDQPVIEDAVLRHPMLGVIRLLRIFQQDPRLQLRPVLLADPGEFEFGLAHQAKANADGGKEIPTRWAMILARAWKSWRTP